MTLFSRLCLTLFLCILPAASKAKDPLPPEIKKIEAYLASFKTLSANLVQKNADGSQAFGRLVVVRPGKLNLSYSDSPIELISDGNWLVQYDKDLQTSTHLDLKSTPAYFIVKSPFKFDEEISIIGFNQVDSLMNIKVARDREASEGWMTLTFQTNPIKLLHWQVVDSQGQETNVYVKDLKLNPRVDLNLFSLRK